MRQCRIFVLFALLIWVWPTSTVAMPNVAPAPADVAAAQTDALPAPVDIAPEPKDIPKPTTEPDKKVEPTKEGSQSEPKIDKVPETAEEAGQALEAFLLAAQEGHWAIFAGLALMLVIWILRRFHILAKMPAKVVPWLAAVLGIAGYIAVGLSQGMIWYTAVGQGFLTGASAVGLWELIFKHLLKKPVEEKPVEDEVKDKPKEKPE